MLKKLQKLSEVLNSVFDAVNFKFTLNSIRGINIYNDPWMPYNDGITLINNYVERRFIPLYKLFLYGEQIKLDEWPLAEQILQDCIDCGFIIKKDNTISTDNYCFVMFDNILLLVELNPSFPNCRKKYSDVYIGYDSFALSRFLEVKKGSCVLDLCSGSGIQGILAARQAKHVTCIEINPAAIPVIEFNILLNGLSGVIEVINSDLFPIDFKHKFDYIFVNPPFIPMLGNTNYPICGDGGEDGLKIIKRIISNLPIYLKNSGLFIMYAQLLGDSRGNLLIEDYIKQSDFAKKWDCIYKFDKRISLANQLAQTYHIAKLIDEEFNDDYTKRMSVIYKKLGVEYLYLTVCKYIINGNGKTFKYDFTNQWELKNTATVSEICIEADKSAFLIKDKSGNLVGYFDNEAIDLINGFKSGKCLSDIINNIYNSDKTDELAKNIFIDNSLEVCRKLEQLGVISKI